ncbi:MAG: sigma-70 family RNA polymerase sigma factor [Dethiobacter sp.]|nr:sigma-70 family RNA polymerase sigma factor [Dethiobacter sp.]
MGQTGGYQTTIEKLYALYKAQGFLREEEALALMTADGVSLVGINRVTDKLLDMGVIFSDGASVRVALDDSNFESDRAQLDYESVFCEALEIAPELKMFVDYIRRVRPPQNREWQMLIPQMRSGNEYAFNRLFDMYLRVVVNIALRFHKDEGIELEDAIQEGAMGLIRAIRQFDTSIHGVMGSYFPLWIQQYISRAVADKGRVIRLPVHAVESLRTILQKKERLAELNEYEPTLLDLSEATGLSINTIENLLVASQETLSLNSLIENDPDFDIVDTKDDIEEIITELSMRDEIQEALSALSDRERHILYLRYGFIDDKEHTLEEISDVYGVTRERVRQIEAKALRKLQHPSRSKRLKVFL